MKSGYFLLIFSTIAIFIEINANGFQPIVPNNNRQQLNQPVTYFYSKPTNNQINTNPSSFSTNVSSQIKLASFFDTKNQQQQQQQQQQQKFLPRTTFHPSSDAFATSSSSSSSVNLEQEKSYTNQNYMNIKLPFSVGVVPIKNKPFPLQKGASYASLLTKRTESSYASPIYPLR